MTNVTTITKTKKDQYLVTIPKAIAQGLQWQDHQLVEWVIVNDNQIMIKKYFPQVSE